MSEVRDVADLIGSIYDAALTPTEWPDTLVKIASFVGGANASLYWKDAASRTAQIAFHSGGLDQTFIDLYFDSFSKFDPSTTAHFFSEIDKPTSTTDYIDYDEFLKTRFYKEWVAPQRLVDNVSVALEKSSTSVALFGVLRHERDGMVDSIARSKMSLLAPHVRRAVLIGKTIDLTASKNATFSGILDQLHSAIFLVDRSGVIAHANLAGLEMISDGRLFREFGGRLVAVDGETDQTLRQMFSDADKGDVAVGTRGIAVPLVSSSGEKYVADFLPLASLPRQRATAPYTASTALFIRKATFKMPPVPEIIAKTFDLTPTELRVLLAVVEVGGVPEVADSLGVAQTTVKFHLRQLFEKTNTRRQADLVKLVAGYGGPFSL